MSVFALDRVSDTTAASQRRHQRATRLSVLPADVQLLLLAKETLPGQARAVRHVVRVRVLPAAVSDQKQSDDAQEPAAQGLGVRAQASDKNRDDRRGHRFVGVCPTAAATAVIASSDSVNFSAVISSTFASVSSAHFVVFEFGGLQLLRRLFSSRHRGGTMITNFVQYTSNRGNQSGKSSSSSSLSSPPPPPGVFFFAIIWSYRTQYVVIVINA